MKFTQALRNLPALLAVMGLLLTPMTRSVSGMPGLHSGSGVALAEDAVASMPADMPCCPDEVPASDCGKDCPLLAICMSSWQIIPGTGLVIPHRLAGHIGPDDDVCLEHLGQAPPGRPPKA